MARKTDEERLRELEKKIEQTKEKKQQLKNRLKQKERKERTRRLIQVGAIFEDYFDFEGVEKAQQYAYSFQDSARKNKETIERIDMEETKKHKKTIYKEPEEEIKIPENKTEYKTEEERRNGNEKD